MPDSGLNINKESFMKLSLKQQNCLLFSNQVTTLREIKKYRFQQKVMSVLLTVGFVAIACLFGLHGFAIGL